MRRSFRFYKTNTRWYIDLPNWQGELADLEMVHGADTMLDKVAEGKNECYLILSDQPCEGADVITLVTDLTDSIGGGDYIMESYKGEIINHKMWICSVAVDVFQLLPRYIYIKLKKDLVFY